MKLTCRVALRFALLVSACSFAFVSTPALAETAQVPAPSPSLPALEALPPVLGADGLVTLSLPANASGSSTSRVAVFEHARPTKLAEIKKSFTLRDGRWSTQLRLEADPGSYDFRIVADDKAHTPLSQEATVIVPGIVREPGWWLLNGSPFSETPGQSEATPSTSAPLFVPGLRRNNGNKSRSVSPVAMSLPLKWRALDVGISLGEMQDTSFFLANFEKQLATKVADEQAHGTRGLMGFKIRKLHDTPTPQDAAELQKLREVLDRIAPQAALILESYSGGGPDGWRLPDPLPSVVDAVLIQDGGLWETKVARRLAEEQSKYDLPVFVSLPSGSLEEPKRAIRNEALAAELLLSGATGVQLQQFPRSSDSNLWRAITRNLPLFMGSVTLEDTGIWMEKLAPVDDYRSARVLYKVLLDSGRIPMHARLQTKPGKNVPESFLSIVPDNMESATIEKLRLAVDKGARIYLEGAPKLDGEAETRWNQLVGIASSELYRSNATMVLDDPWIFGTLRGSELAVEQQAKVTISVPASNEEAKQEKGKDILTGPRVVAHLKDGSPALIFNPIGDGEVLWSPHQIHPDYGANIESGFNLKTRKFYSAVAAQLQGALVSTSPRGTRDAAVRTAIRRSSGGAWLIGLFNANGEAAPITLEANHFAGVALDLATERELSFHTRGNRTFVQTTVPASGWQILALGESRKALDDERFEPRAKAKLE